MNTKHKADFSKNQYNIGLYYINNVSYLMSYEY